MTISTTSNSVTLLGNGSTTAFSFNFVYDSAADIFVIFTDATGAQTALSSTQYTLVLNPPALGSIWGVGGTVTYPLVGSPIANGTSLTIYRQLPYTQNTSISNQGDFYPQVVEAALDTLCMETQQLAAQVTRSIQAPIVDGNPVVILPAAAARAGMYLAFDGSGNVIVSPGTSGGGISPLAPYFTPTSAVLPPSGNGLYYVFTNTLGFAAHGALSVAVSNPANAVDYIEFVGAATSGSTSPAFPLVLVGGTDPTIGLSFDTKGTTTSGSQYNGNGPQTSGTYNFFINNAQALQLTDTYWNPNVSYQGATTSWVVISSGALAGGPDNIAVISCNSSIYPATATGVTLVIGGKGATGSIHFLNNGLLGHVSIGAPTNPSGIDQYHAPNALWFSGTAAGSGSDVVIFTNYGLTDSTIGMTFYNEGTSGFTFLSDNAGSVICKMNRVMNAVNYLQFYGAAAGSNPVVGTAGPAGNIRLSLSGVDDAGVDICNRLGQYPIARFSAGFAPADGLQVQGQGAGSGPILYPFSTGSNAPMNISSLGTGSVVFFANSSATALLELQNAGTVKFRNAASFTANATATITVSNLGPAGITTATIKKWLTIVDNAGVTLYIPAWGA